MRKGKPRYIKLPHGKQKQEIENTKINVERKTRKKEGKYKK